MSAWQLGTGVIAAGLWIISNKVPVAFVVVLPIAVRLGIVIVKAAEWKGHRMVLLYKELAAAIWGNLLLIPLGLRILHNYYTPRGAIFKDIDFGSPNNQGRNRLDIHCLGPSGNSLRRPVVFFLYGGAWHSGDKVIYTLVGNTLKQHNVVVVIPNYSIYPTGTMADMAEDVSYALGWTVQHISEYGGDPSKIYIVGHSAGGHLAVSTILRRWCADNAISLSDVLPSISLASPPPPPLAILPHLGSSSASVFLPDQRRSLPKAQWSLTNVRAVVAICAPFDILDHYEFEKKRGVHLLSGMWPAAYGDPEANSCLKLVQSLSIRQGPKASTAQLTDLPKVHVLHSTSDTVVPQSQAFRFHESLLDAGIPCSDKVIQFDGTHFSPIEAIMLGHKDAPALAYILDLIHTDPLSSAVAR